MIGQVMVILLLALIIFLCYRHQRLLAYAYHYLCMQWSVRLFILRRQTTADLFAARLKATPEKTAIIFEGKSHTFASLERLSNRVAEWAMNDIHLQPRSVVALLMENSPDFITIWLGLAKIGVTTALVNTNLRGQGLIHSLRCCDASLVIVGEECWEAFQTIRSELGPTMKVWIYKNSSSSSTGTSSEKTRSISPARSIVPSVSSPSSSTSGSVSSHLSLPPPEDLTAALSQKGDFNHDFHAMRVAAGLNSSDLLFYIFTSGTTGLPKAAKIKHLRWQMAAASFCNFFSINSQDRIYCCLPMYHSAGGMIGIGCSWFTGAALVLRRKFSASKFFEDCAQNDVTIIQYIGQLARYLLSTPPSPYDTQHCVRMAIGNGIGDAWEAFRQRFKIETIGEFYASTEGNANLVNAWNIPHVIGWIPPIARLIYPIRIVRFDTIEEKPIRDEHGHCIECGVGEIGELVSKIDNLDPLRHFDGYTSARATSEKILAHVFRQGDKWFRSGDLVKADEEGFIRFVDRVGDTFRWKGENVATTEVASIMSSFHSSTGIGLPIAEVNVYGVYIPGNEGRAGMASITLERPSQQPVKEFSETDFDFTGFYHYLHSQLPTFQNPLFLRFQKQMDITSTFKQRKSDLVTEGFDPTTIRDPIYFRDDATKQYQRLDANLFQAIQKGSKRV